MATIHTNAAELCAALRAASLAAPLAADVHGIKLDPLDMHRVFKFSANGSRSSIKVRNTRERLEQMALTVERNQALYGGGIQRTPKARSAGAWSAAAVRAAKVVRELLEDGQYLEALELSESACGGRFALDPEGVPMLHMLAEDGSVDSMQTMLREDGRWLTIEPASGRALYNTSAYKAGRTTAPMRSRSAANACAADAAQQAGAQRVAQAIATYQAAPADQAALRAEWLARRGVLQDGQPVEADNTHTSETLPTVTNQVAAVVAQAMATAAIEQASEAAALQELGSIEAARETTDQAAHAEQAAPALAMADAGGSTGATPSMGHAASTPTAPGAGQGQAIHSKSGHWSARFFTNTAGAPCMEFSQPGRVPCVVEFETGADRMRTLQQSAKLADQAAKTPDITEENLIAAGIHPSVADSIKRHGLSAYGPEAQEEILAKLGASAQDSAADTEPTTTGANHTALRETLKDNDAQHQNTPMDALHDTAQDLGGAPSWRKVEPLAMDLRAAIAAGVPITALVGMGVHYTGDCANEPGDGAIVSTEACKWAGVRVVVQLEDGRSMTATGAEFGDKPGDRLRLDWKLHGAPYLAQLGAAVAARKAAKTSAEELAKQAHAAELGRLAAEFPLLKRADSANRGGKLAAVNIRTLLKDAFKGVKFSVTSDYSSVRIRWTDGPSAEHVEKIIGAFDIGAADHNTDYFYTVATAFSELFGGVQYLFTERELSNTTISAALVQLYGTDGPSVEDYRKGRAWNEVDHGKTHSPSSYCDRWEWLSQVRRAAQGISHA